MSTLEKVTNNFWKVWGIIDGFNNSRRNISSGVENKSYQSMSVIWFRTTSKGDLTHYLFIFRNPEPLGMELNNAECYSLGDMLYLEIQNKKEVIKKLEFQQVIGGTDAWMNRIMKANKGCGKLSSNDTLFYDIWFSGVKAA